MAKDDKSLPPDPARRKFLCQATTVVTGIGLAAATVPFISSMLPSEKTQAAGAPVEVDVSTIPPGMMITVAWRGKPVWIIHRTPEMLETLKQNLKELRDPSSHVEQQQPMYAQNEYRSLKPEYLVLIGICTHLGCSPLYYPKDGELDAQWKGGFFCPCHGSRFDLAGRVFKGVPAPINLEVPPYRFISDTVLVIGEDPEQNVA